MVLDECLRLTNNKKKLNDSVDLTIEWAQRSKTEFGNCPNKECCGGQVPGNKHEA